MSKKRKRLKKVKKIKSKPIKKNNEIESTVISYENIVVPENAESIYLVALINENIFTYKGFILSETETEYSVYMKYMEYPTSETSERNPYISVRNILKSEVNELICEENTGNIYIYLKNKYSSIEKDVENLEFHIRKIKEKYIENIGYRVKVLEHKARMISEITWYDVIKNF